MGGLMKRAMNQLDVWLVTPPGEHECHVWYRGRGGAVRRICDDSLWPDGKRLVASRTQRRTPCLECRGLVEEDAGLMDAARVKVLIGDTIPW